MGTREYVRMVIYFSKIVYKQQTVKPKLNKVEINVKTSHQLQIQIKMKQTKKQQQT